LCTPSILNAFGVGSSEISVLMPLRLIKYFFILTSIIRSPAIMVKKPIINNKGVTAKRCTDEIISW
jgi:hypothetical protein